MAAVTWYFFLDHSGGLLHLAADPLHHQRAAGLLAACGRSSGGEEEENFRRLLKECWVGSRQTMTWPVNPFFLEQATDFQLRVWSLLCTIDRGTVKTYGDLAAELGRPGAARAVGQACHHNPLLLFIPCHRLVAATGLGGFAGGQEVKRHLLELEGVAGLPG